MNRNCLALATLLIAAAPNAFGNTAQVNVTGTITPAACQITLANGGIFDLGEINVSALGQDSATSLPAQVTDLNVECTSATRFAISAIDHNEADNPDSTYLDNMSLGRTAAGEWIGFFYSWVVNPMSGTEALYSTRSLDGGQTWNPSVGTGTAFRRNGAMIGYTIASGTDTGPTAIQRLSGQLRLSARINAASSLTLTDEQAIDGGMTLTVEFL
ncbi:DUF1120 domain-containing protein [Stenotrophomonas sp.]|uniref:DUF1120 domain-containing protein n=1 Tax=Stenotrophomonas sp. TaxID=69392 RepID=UPI0028AAE9E9|nr:DUF1120 domain-containing protein [Stenotrophomonas sp.]